MNKWNTEKYKNINNRNYDSNYLQNTFKVNPKNKIHSFYMGETFFNTPEFIAEKIVARALKHNYGYTFLDEEFYSSVKSWLNTIHGVSVNKEWIHMSYGTIPSLMYLIQEFSKTNDYILINTPVYGPFEEVVINSERKLVINKLQVIDDYFQFDFVDFENKIKNYQVKIFILCSPHNPGGRVWSKNEIEKVLKICQKYHVLVLSDEVNSDISFSSKKFYSILHFTKLYDNFIMLSSPNKAFTLGGLKTSYFISHNKNINNKINKAKAMHRVTSPNIFGQIGLIEAYKHGSNYLKELNQLIKTNYKIALKEFSVCKNIEIMKTDATYFIWINFHKLKISIDVLRKRLIEKNVIITFGDQFVDNAKSWGRLNIAMPTEDLISGIKVILKLIK